MGIKVEIQRRNKTPDPSKEAGRRKNTIISEVSEKGETKETVYSGTKKKDKFRNV